MKNPKAVRNLVIGLFIGFFVAGGIAIFIAIRLDRAKQAQITALTLKNQQAMANMVKENDQKIQTLADEYARQSDSLNFVIQKQEVKIERLEVTISHLKYEQGVLARELAEFRASRDSVLHDIKID